jgi:hypothetical protein
MELIREELLMVAGHTVARNAVQFGQRVCREE